MKAIGDRMKENYENRSRFKLVRRVPVVLRLDGKAFHTVTKGCERPFDEHLNKCMVDTAKYLLENIQGSKLAYTQSDEISILLTDFDRIKTDAWFDYNLQKIVSVSAGYASAKFTMLWRPFQENPGPIIFDSRAFNIPKEEVCNYFVWRQLDWDRNSVQMIGQAHFSHKQLHKKSTHSDIHEMLHTKGINWAHLEPKWKNGVTLSKVERNIIEHHDYIFSKDRGFVEKYLINGED